MGLFSKGKQKEKSEGSRPKHGKASAQKEQAAQRAREFKEKVQVRAARADEILRKYHTTRGLHAFAVHAIYRRQKLLRRNYRVSCHQAASKIQRRWRHRRSELDVQYQKASAAALKIQSIYRGHFTRQMLRFEGSSDIFIGSFRDNWDRYDVPKSPNPFLRTNSPNRSPSPYRRSSTPMGSYSPYNSRVGSPIRVGSPSRSPSSRQQARPHTSATPNRQRTFSPPARQSTAYSQQTRRSKTPNSQKSLIPSMIRKGMSSPPFKPMGAPTLRHITRSEREKDATKKYLERMAKKKESKPGGTYTTKREAARLAKEAKGSLPDVIYDLSPTKTSGRPLGRSAARPKKSMHVTPTNENWSDHDDFPLNSFYNHMSKGFKPPKTTSSNRPESGRSDRSFVKQSNEVARDGRLTLEHYNFGIPSSPARNTSAPTQKTDAQPQIDGRAASASEKIRPSHASPLRATLALEKQRRDFEKYSQSQIENGNRPSEVDNSPLDVSPSPSPEPLHGSAGNFDHVDIQLLAEEARDAERGTKAIVDELMRKGQLLDDTSFTREPTPEKQLRVSSPMSQDFCGHRNIVSRQDSPSKKSRQLHSRAQISRVGLTIPVTEHRPSTTPHTSWSASGFLPDESRSSPVLEMFQYRDYGDFSGTKPKPAPSPAYSRSQGLAVGAPGTWKKSHPVLNRKSRHWGRKSKASLEDLQINAHEMQQLSFNGSPFEVGADALRTREELLWRSLEAKRTTLLQQREKEWQTNTTASVDNRKGLVAMDLYGMYSSESKWLGTLSALTEAKSIQKPHRFEYN